MEKDREHIIKFYDMYEKVTEDEKRSIFWLIYNSEYQDQLPPEFLRAMKKTFWKEYYR